jgi:ATP-dependent DNA ligase
MPRPYKRNKTGEFSFIFPPRPEHRISVNSLVNYDNGEYNAEPKLNGSNCSLYLDGKSFDQKNRHRGDISNFKMDSKEIIKLHRGKGDMLVVGEYMNKSQKDINGKVFNNKFVIFDIIVYNSEHLVGLTYVERRKILTDIFGTKSYDDYLYQVSENVFMTKSFEGDFTNLYNKIVKIDMLEGWVLKRKNGKLERGTREKNNIGWMIKCRKQTLNYQF